MHRENGKSRRGYRGRRNGNGDVLARLTPVRSRAPSVQDAAGDGLCAGVCISTGRSCFRGICISERTAFVNDVGMNVNERLVRR